MTDTERLGWLEKNEASVRHEKFSSRPWTVVSDEWIIAEGVTLRDAIDEAARVKELTP